LDLLKISVFLSIFSDVYLSKVPTRYDSLPETILVIKKSKKFFAQNAMADKKKKNSEHCKINTVIALLRI
jgi:hypothetical protein